jgi:hypothetical protein
MPTLSRDGEFGAATGPREMIGAVSRSRNHLGRRRLFATLIGLVLLAAAGTTPARASFTPAAGTPLAVGAQPYTALAQDFNGDGRVDVAAMNGSSSTLSVFQRSPLGEFAPAMGSPLATGAGPSKAAVADFNADGRTDFAVSNYSSGTVSVLLGQTGGGWAPEAGSPSVPSPGSVAVADVNADGRPDLLAPDYNGAGVAVFLRLAGGGFAAEGGKAPTGANPRDLVVADFNGDGRPDMAVANFGSDTVSVLLRQPGGGFAAEAGSPVPVGAKPLGIVAPDLDGDGRPDLAVTNAGSDSVSLLLRQASGGFAADPASPVATGDEPLGIAAPDFDGDGRPDLAIANHASGTVSVLLRRGGGYQPDAGSPIALPAGPSGVAAADVDGDGRPDLVVSSDQANVLSVLLNRIPRPGSGPGSPTPTGGGAGSAPLLRPPPVVGVPASALEVAGAGGKVSPALERALSRADLEASLRSVPASSRVEEQASKQTSAPDPAVQSRLESFAYGIPVEVQGRAGEVVEVAAAVAIASRSEAGAEVALVQLPPMAAQLTGPKTVVRLHVDEVAAAELQQKGVTEAAVAVVAKEVDIVKNELDGLSEMGEMESLRLQMAMDRMSKMMSTLSNLLKKIGETSSTITENLKRPSGGGARSGKSVRRRADAAAKAANAAGHKAAVLLAPVVRAHPSRSPRVTVALKPCPKRCAYPRFR